MKAVVLAILAIFFSSGLAQAAIPIKIVSGLPGDLHPMNGSGLLFSRSVDGATHVYVITSDHVGYHSSVGYESAIYVSETVGYPASYLASDWGNGLALFEVRGFPDSPAGLEFPAVAQAAVGMGAVTRGFPFGSYVLVQSDQGYVGTLASPFPFFVLPFPLYEVLGDAGEYGMSGGPVESPGGELVGLLSDQVIETNSQGALQAVEWRNGQEIENHLVVVPGQVVQDWIEAYFRDPAAFRAFYFMDPNTQKENGDYLYTGNAMLATACAYDGVSQILHNKCDTEFDLMRSPRGGLLKYQFATFSQLEALLKTRPELTSATIMGFRPPLGVWQGGQPELYESQDRFFQLMTQVERGELVPLVTLNYQDDYKDLENLVPQAKPIADELDGLLRRAPAPRLTEAFDSLLDFITVENEDDPDDPPDTWWAIRAADIDQLMNPADPAFGPEWRSMDPGLATQVRAKLSALRNLLGKVEL